MLKINEFAKKTDFSVRMLRYLEERGLLVASRDQSYYRVYSEAQLSEAAKIKRLQSLGLQFKEIESLKNGSSAHHLLILTKVIERDREVAEIKFETIPELKNMIDILSAKEITINDYWESYTRDLGKKFEKDWGENPKFYRVAYSIPILRNIYEDHLAIDANLELIKTDYLKFGEWLDTEVDFEPDVFSILNGASFCVGENITEQFVSGYEESWKKFLPALGLNRLWEFSTEDLPQLFGAHDVIMRTTYTNIYNEYVVFKKLGRINGKRAQENLG